MIVVGTTIPAFKAEDPAESIAWLDAAKQRDVPGHQIVHFAALELDARGLAPFHWVQTSLAMLGGAFWTFQVDDGAEKIDSVNRLIRICTGRNLIVEYAQRIKAEWILFHDSDLMSRPDALNKLLEVGHPLVGGDVPAYCLSGPVEHEYPFPVERHWNTAGFLLAHIDLARQIAWGHDCFHGTTDDPWYAQAARRLGVETLVRKDVVGVHKPLVALEQRPHDRRYVRDVPA